MKATMDSHNCKSKVVLKNFLKFDGEKIVQGVKEGKIFALLKFKMCVVVDFESGEFFGELYNFNTIKQKFKIFDNSQNPITANISGRKSGST